MTNISPIQNPGVIIFNKEHRNRNVPRENNFFFSQFLDRTDWALETKIPRHKQKTHKNKKNGPKSNSKADDSVYYRDNGLEPINPLREDELPKFIKDNPYFVEPGRVAKLRPLQRYIVRLMQRQRDFIAVGKKTCGRTLAYCGSLADTVNVHIQINGKKPFPPRPFAIIIAEKKETVDHIEVQLRKVIPSQRALLAKLNRDYFESNTTQYLNKHILFGTIDDILEAVKIYAVDFNDLNYVVIDDGEMLNSSSYALGLKEFYNQHIPPAIRVMLFVSVFCNSLVHSRLMEDTLSLYFKGKKLSDVIEVSHSPSVNPQFVEIYRTAHHEKKMRTLRGLLSDSDNRTSHYERSFLIITNSTESVYFLTAYIQLLHYDAKPITQDLEIWDLEDIVSDFRSKNLRVIVTDYESLRDLDLGFVGNTIIFDMPKPDFGVFLERMKDVLYLSEKNDRRKLIFFYQEGAEHVDYTNKLIKFMIIHKQFYPRILLKQLEYCADIPTSVQPTTNPEQSTNEPPDE